ncbi:MAG: TOBE domain-containing protein, partial [Saezia sp.]
ARQLGMSYKTAWDMLNDMNNLSEEPLVIRTKGGRHGGGTVLTEYGKKMIVTFRLIEAEYQTMLFALEQRYPELSQWQNMRQRLQLRTSARNQLFCKIQALEKHGHLILVTLDLGEKQLLQAQLTQASVDEMGLSVGRQVVALMKAPLISMSTQHLPDVQMLEGVLQHVDEDDAGGAEVEILLKSGQTLIAMLEDVKGIPQIGSPVYVAIDPKQVILAIF